MTGTRSAARIALLIVTWVVRLVAVILVIATFNFVLVRAAPGDPAMVMAGQSGGADPKILDDLRKEYGLDKPYLVQLGTHLGRVLTLDLGYSYRQRRPVLDLILERLPATLLLTLTAFCLALADRHDARRARGSGRRKHRRYAVHGALAAALRHAGVLARADARPRLLGDARLAAAVRLRDHQREDDGDRTHRSTSPST